MKTGWGGPKGSSLKLDWLRTTFSAGSDSRDPDEATRCARGYLLFLFGCSMFVDKSGNRVGTQWLEFLQDMRQVSRYAWGAAVLAYLYKQLGQAAKNVTRQIGGCMTLLEVCLCHYCNQL